MVKGKYVSWNIVHFKKTQFSKQPYEDVQSISLRLQLFPKDVGATTLVFDLKRALYKEFKQQRKEQGDLHRQT